MLNLSENIPRIQITKTMTDAEALAFKNDKYVLMHADKKRLGIQMLDYTAALIKPDGHLLALLLKDILDPELCDIAYKLLRQVNGDPSNRPSIIGKNAMMLDLNKDGMPGVQMRVPASVLDVYKGKADMLGSYRYKNSAPGVVNCDLTSWTKSRPDIYLGVMRWILEVNNVYRNFLPEPHARQMAYVNLIPDERRIPDTAFTTLYVLLNAPTACHTDDADIQDGFGVMAANGLYTGSELAFIKYLWAVDYQPTDLLLGDVHEIHANFPLIAGERVACVFFCREGQHECPTP
jgi:hypothetical protein